MKGKNKKTKKNRTQKKKYKNVEDVSFSFLFIVSVLPFLNPSCPASFSFLVCLFR